MGTQRTIRPRAEAAAGSHMNQRDTRSVIGVTMAAGSNAAVAALFGIVTARTLGPGGQGALTAVTTAVAIVVVAATLGTGASMRLRSVPEPARADVRAFVGLSLLLAPIGGAVGCLVVAATQPHTASTAMLVATFFLGAASFVARQAAELVQVFSRPGASIVSAAVGILGQLIFFGAIALTGHASLELAVVSGIVGATVQTAFAIATIRSHHPPLQPSMSPALWRELVAHGSPTVGYGLGLITMQRVDRLILVALGGPVAGGLYAVAATMAEVARLSSTAIGQLLFVRTSASGSVGPSTRRIYRVGVAIQAVTLTATGIAAPVLVPAFFGEDYVSAVPLLRGLVVAEFLLGLALMDSRILLGLGRFVEVSVITVTCVVLSLPVYTLLVEASGARGAVIGSISIYALYSGTLTLRRRTHGVGTGPASRPQ